MCFVINIHSITGYFQEENSCFSRPISAQMQAMKTSETYIAYAPPMGEHKNEQEISGMPHYFEFLT